MLNNAPFLPFATLGMFIVDDFEYLDENGQPTGRTAEPQERDAWLAIYQTYLTGTD
jgi:hypothetical protein